MITALPLFFLGHCVEQKFLFLKIFISNPQEKMYLPAGFEVTKAKLMYFHSHCSLLKPQNIKVDGREQNVCHACTWPAKPLISVTSGATPSPLTSQKQMYWTWHQLVNASLKWSIFSITYRWPRNIPRLVFKLYKALCIMQENSRILPFLRTNIPSRMMLGIRLGLKWTC